jgi:hypothetical protein
MSHGSKYSRTILVSEDMQCISSYYSSGVCLAIDTGCLMVLLWILLRCTHLMLSMIPVRMSLKM